MDVGAFIRSDAGVPWADIQFHFLPALFIDHGQKSGHCHAYQVACAGGGLSYNFLQLLVDLINQMVIRLPSNTENPVLAYVGMKIDLFAFCLISATLCNAHFFESITL